MSSSSRGHRLIWQLSYIAPTQVHHKQISCKRKPNLDTRVAYYARLQPVWWGTTFFIRADGSDKNGGFPSMPGERPRINPASVTFLVFVGYITVEGISHLTALSYYPSRTKQFIYASHSKRACNQDQTLRDAHIFVDYFSWLFINPGLYILLLSSSNGCCTPPIARRIGHVG